jgi:hypothetical protein
MSDTKCEDCGSTDLDDRGNCWACLGRKGDAQVDGTAKPAPVAASAEVEEAWDAMTAILGEYLRCDGFPCRLLDAITAHGNAVAAAEKARADANEKALRGLLDGIDVCHVCGTALVADSDSIGSRCDEHANADEGSEDEDAEPWYMPAQEWRKRVARARAILGLDKEPHG